MMVEVSLFKDKKTGEFVADVTGKSKDGKSTFSVYDASKYEKLDSADFEVEEPEKTLSDKMIHTAGIGYDKLLVSDVKLALKEFKARCSRSFTNLNDFERFKEHEYEIFGEGLLK